MANEFVARNGLISLDNSTITGSLTVTNGITGSLFGTSSWAQNAVTASFVSSASFATTASFVTSASFATTASFALNANIDSVTGSFVTIATDQTITGSKTFTPVANSTPIVISGYLATGSSAVPALDITGSWNTSGTPTLIRANVTNIASNAASLLMDLQVGGTSQFSVRRDGRVGNAGTTSYVGRTIDLTGGGANTNIVVYQAGLGYTATSGIGGSFRSTSAFNPTSGTAILNVFQASPTINQTGGANGITRGLFIEPTLTSAADWRSIEWSNNSGWGLYGIGTAVNHLTGNLLLGTLVNAGFRLDVNGTTRLQNTLTVSAGGANITGDTVVTGSLTVVTGSSRELQVTPTGVNIGSILTDAHTVTGSISVTGSLTNAGGSLSLIPSANTSGLVLSGYSLTGSNVQAAIDISGSWNTTGVASFIRGYVTNTASGANSRLIDLGVGTTRIFSITTSGNARTTGTYLATEFNADTLPSSGIINVFTTTATFSRTTGTNTYAGLNLSPTINQTGAATGITRGVLISPTLTSALDWRSIEWTNATGFGLYGSGSASNVISGSTTIGSLTPGPGVFNVVGRTNLSGSTTITGSLGVGVTPSATTGRIDASNDIVAFSTSDARLKTDVQPISDPINKLSSIEGVTFKWIDEHKPIHGYEGTDVGVIAQQIQQVLPEAVRENNTGYLSVRYEKIIPLLIEAIKDQQNQIDELKAKLDAINR